MARILDVWFHGNKAGQLHQEDGGRLQFVYAADYLKSEQPWPLSVSMPPGAAPFEDRIARPFFSGLLPEDLIRRKVAKLLGVSEKNPFSMLEAIGRMRWRALPIRPRDTAAQGKS